MRNCIILMLISAGVARGGFERTEAGARSMGLAGAYTACAGDAWTTFYNPAGLAWLRGAEAGFFISPRPFGFGELSFAAAAAAVGTSFGAIGFTGSRYGFSLYREQSFGLTIAARTSLGNVGLTLVHYAVTIERYGTGSSLGVNAGYTLELDRTLRIGCRVRNLNAPMIGAAGERLRESVAMGLAYQPIAELLLSADLVKELSFEPSLRAGAEYVVASAIVIRLGVTDQPSEFHTGVGVRQGLVSFDYAVSLHEDLGTTHEFSLSLLWGGGGNE